MEGKGRAREGEGEGEGEGRPQKRNEEQVTERGTRDSETKIKKMKERRGQTYLNKCCLCFSAQ